VKNSYAFIIRIWLEKRKGQGKIPEYRGVIQAVGDNETDHPEEKVHFRDVQQIAAYFNKFLENKGIKTGFPRSLSQWVKGKLLLLLVIL